VSAVPAEDREVAVQKFTVYARTPQMPGGPVFGPPIEDGTFFVIRDSDVFGPAVLFAYVSLLQTELEVEKLRPGRYSPEELAYLEKLERYVTDLALSWQRTGKGRVPD
jgi:hypothetical protein